MSQVLDYGWLQLGYTQKLAVLLLVLSAVPPVIWLLTRPWTGTEPRRAHSPGVPTWVRMEAAALLIALLLFGFGWFHRLDGLDCAGPCHSEAEAELTWVFAWRLVLLIIPVLGMLTWALVSRRRRRQS